MLSLVGVPEQSHMMVESQVAWLRPALLSAQLRRAARAR